MASIVSRSANIATSIKATSQVVASSVRLPAPSVLAKDEKVVALKSPLSSSSIPSSYAGSLPFGALKISSGIGAGTQVRYAHTDLQIPNFDEVRRPKTRDPKSKSEDTAVSRHAFTYLISGSSILVGVYATKHIVRGAVSTLSASKDVLALAKIEIKTDDIPEGKSMTFKWRGKPIFVKHRTEAEIEIERSVDLSSLRDPQHDNDRIQDPKWLVVIGVCTHLGCVPIANAGEYGGYYCPCHGSHYDGSGRIRKGPAPLNLEVPEYSFPEPGLLVVG